ncbi:excinuclease ABC subunit UvrC [Gleimia hominis]|uniref:excinuclease ABC subunit UvrC n=1 Tax=Gleimia hominis TaxID=595468 RepID=UPI000C807565|nr:excinuclease ABC subunit UvrC [Gleimia hominis]WIK65020.1 excinuclease ABC subunit UvrC [Gleimia hominis]
MADPSTYAPARSQIPTDPGVYRFRDRQGRVIYVGKAKNLRNRLSSYFNDVEHLHPRTHRMVTTASSVQWTVVKNEVEALTLEYSWIKQYSPRFNIIFRDDKSYPYLAVSMGEEIPRMQVMRGARKPGTRYFGPYSQVYALHKTVDQLQSVFPVRTCSAGVLRRAQASGRPCLLGDIDRCSAPCVGRISLEDHRAMAEEICRFMAGKVGPFIRARKEEMREAADALDFERAARLRDDIKALEQIQEQNVVVLNDGTDADFFALVSDELESAVQVFHVRGGRIRGARAWVIDREENVDDAELMERLLQQAYADVDQDPTARQREAAVSVDDVEHTPTSAIPAQVLVSVLPTKQAVMQRWLSKQRGAHVELLKPQRGDKRKLMDTVRSNAKETMRLHKMRRAGDLTQRTRSLNDLVDALGLEEAPLRIECYDISHTQGSYPVGSMVVFEDGAPRKKDYRHFIVRGTQEGTHDDTAAMREVLTRRFKRLLAEEAGIEGEDADGVPFESGAVDPNTGLPRRFSYRPDLVVVDGGLPQVNAAQATLDELGVDIPVIGLAKRLEEVWIPNDEYPAILPRTSEGLYLLQYLRDESHRFAITHHRKRRGKAMTKSVLDTVPGLGPAKQKALLRHFKSVKRIRAATREQLQEVKGIGPELARQIDERLAKKPGSEPKPR